MKKNFLINISLPIIAACFFLFMLISISSKKDPENREPLIPPPSTNFSHKIAGLGIIESDTRIINIGSPIAGIISKIYVTEGMYVKKGTPLFKIEDTEIKAQLENAEAKMKVAQIHYEDVSHNLNLFESIKDKRAISYEEISRKRFAAQKAYAQMVEAMTNLKVVQMQANKFIIRSPIDSHVLKINSHLGEFVNGNDNTAMTLGTLHDLNVRVEIDETDIHRIDQDAQAIGILRGQPDVKINLKFLRYDPYVIPKSNLANNVGEKIDTRIIELVYEFDHSQITVFPGQRMDVFIEELK